MHLAVLQQAQLSPTTPRLALVNNDKLITNGLGKGGYGNRLEKRDTLFWKKFQDPAGYLLIFSQTLLPLSYWTQVAAECRKMAFP